jgi:hypothetical protein
LIKLSACSASGDNVKINEVSQDLENLGPVDLLSKNAEPYHSKFLILNHKDGSTSLLIDMELYGGSYFISPKAKRPFKGKFNVSIDQDSSLSLGDLISETPPSTALYDPHPFIDGEVNWINVNTRYEYALNVNPDEDFEVSGRLTFVIEPRCTLETLEFVISQRDGELSVARVGD